MCLAVPGRVLECGDAEALVDMQGNRLNVSTTLTPDVVPGSWVLIHAGFALTTLSEHDALETWDYLRQAFGNPVEIIQEPESNAPDEGGLS
jgi:hydrogenase expression/formation protein HypC